VDQYIATAHGRPLSVTSDGARRWSQGLDADALPAAIVSALKAGTVNVNDPAVTLQLLGLNAVVGVIAKVSTSGTLESIGVTCALCHSTVDNSLAPGIGHRLDGWPNTTLNVGAIISLSPVSRVRATAGWVRDIHGRWTHFLLEQLRGRHADGWSRQLLRPAHWSHHHSDTRSRHAEIAGAPRLSTVAENANTPARQF